MDGARFDNLTRQLAASTSRRALLKAVLGSAAGGLLTIGARDQAAGFICRQPGVLCAKDAHCCSESCGEDHRCACPDGSLLCDRACVDPTTDPANCGGCGSACAAGATCQGGTCGGGCASGTASCDGACVDTSSDPAHCGDCGTVCAGTAHGQSVCTSGSCGITCDDGYELQDTACVPIPASECTSPADCDTPADPCGVAVCTNGACGIVPANPETVCRPGSCTAGQAIPATTCDGTTTTCPPAPAPQSCGLYTGCAGTGCATSCQSNDGCVSGAHCADDACVPDEGVGEPCDAAAACTSGVCVGGICCAQTCPPPEHGTATCADGFTCGVSCEAGFQVCAGGCIADDACCTVADCTPDPAQCQGTPTCTADHTCSFAPVPAGTTCGEDRVCCGGVCCAAGQTCASGVCTTAACQPEGASCTADQPCCTGLTCTAGACVAACSSCQTYDPEQGTCVNVADATPCPDFPCFNGGGFCFSGVCMPFGQQLPDNHGCQPDACTAGVCQFGQCQVLGPLTCHHLDSDCQVGVCDLEHGGCHAVNRADGTDCPPAYPCAAISICVDGHCVSNGVRDDRSPCDVDACHVNGQCIQGGCEFTESPVACGPCQTCQDGACVADPTQSGATCGDGQICCGGTCQEVVGLGGLCFSFEDDECCQDEETVCARNESGNPRCCHPAGGSCEDDSHCCGSTTCGDGLCGGGGSPCEFDPGVCASGSCCNDTCCAPGEVCYNDGTINPSSCVACQQLGEACRVSSLSNTCCIDTVDEERAYCIYKASLQQETCCHVTGGSCEDDTHCCGDETCSEGICGGKGATCTGSGYDNRCVSNICCDGVCCGAGEICVDGVCQVGACLGLGAVCNPGTCCEDDQSMDCVDRGNGVYQCRHRVGGSCQNDGECSTPGGIPSYCGVDGICGGVEAYCHIDADCAFSPCCGAGGFVDTAQCCRSGDHCRIDDLRGWCVPQVCKELGEPCVDLEHPRIHECCEDENDRLVYCGGSGTCGGEGAICDFLDFDGGDGSCASGHCCRDGCC